MSARFVLALATLVFAVSGAHAQRIDCTPTPACTQDTTFTPTGAQYSAAIGGALAADVGNRDVELKTFGTDGPYNLEVRTDGWSLAAPLRLQARYAVREKGPNAGSWTTDWLDLGVPPARILSGEAANTEVDATYRLLIEGDEPAGTFETTLTYRVWDDAGGPARKAQREVSHRIRVTIPTFLELRIDGDTTIDGRGTVYFDYTPPNGLAYLDAVVDGTPLPMTGADLRRVEISTNNATGYTVDVSVLRVSGPAGSSLGSGDLLLDGIPADGAQLVGDGPTAGFETLVTPDRYALHVDGAEVPGAYRFSIIFTARRNP